MSQEINIPFKSKIEAGETKFKVPIPRYRWDHGLHFKFLYLELLPEFYSLQAQAYNFDSDAENAEVYKYPIQLDFKFETNYINPENSAHQWVQSTKDTDIGKTLKSLNNFFESIKPIGMVEPPVFFDWFMVDYLNQKGDFDEYHQNVAILLYDESYDATKHSDWLPLSARKPGIHNNQIFPTTTDERFLSRIRIRMHISPNTLLGFSNDTMLKAFGFSDNQIPTKKSVSSQILISNDQANKPYSIASEGEFGKLTAATSNKVAVYIYAKSMKTPLEYVKTTRLRSRDPAKVAADFNPTIQELAKQANQQFELEYDTTYKKFKFQYPSNQNVKIDVLTVPILAKQMGFGNGITKITKDMDPIPIQIETGDRDTELKARTLGYDIGIAMVAIEQTNLQTIQLNNTLMAILEPNPYGCIKMGCNLTSNEIYVTNFSGPEIEFIITRLSENGQPVPLDLPVAAYAQGILVGRI